MKKKKCPGIVRIVANHVQCHLQGFVGVHLETAIVIVLMFVLTRVKICVQIPVIDHVWEDVLVHAQADVLGNALKNVVQPVALVVCLAVNILVMANVVMPVGHQLRMSLVKILFYIFE